MSNFRKIAREAVIFMLGSAVLTGAVTLAYELYERHKAVVERLRAAQKYKEQKDHEASQLAANPTNEHPFWIYIDVAQQYDGYYDERPHPPPQIAKLVKDGVHCLPGSVTWAEGNVEWVCVLPSTKPANYHTGDIMLFDMTKATPVASAKMGQYSVEDIDADALQPVIKNYSDIGLESLLLSGFGFVAGFGLWLLYRLVRFAVKG